MLRIVDVLLISCAACSAFSCSITATPQITWVNSMHDMKEEDMAKLFVEERGEGDPVLLIHGFGASSYSWRYVISDLSKEYRVLAIDLKGFGRSEKPFDLTYSIYDQAKLVSHYIEKHNLTNLTIIGHSYGGGVTLATAIRLLEKSSQRLKKLVLIDTVAYEQEMPLFIKILRTPLLGSIGVAVLPPELQTRSILKLAYYDDDKIPHESVIAYAKPLHSASGRYSVVEVAKQMLPVDINEFSNNYKKIFVPALIIWGRNDEIVPIEIGKRLHSNLPNSTFQVVENCGHIPHEETPTVTIELIRKFLKD